MPNTKQPAIVPFSVHPPKITAAMAMKPRPATPSGSKVPTWASVRKPPPRPA